MKQQIAPESEKTKKIREKLRKLWSQIDEKVTPEALQEKSEEIHRLIARRAASRVRLKKKKIALFDENQNPAKVGPRVRAMVQRLKSEISK